MGATTSKKSKSGPVTTATESGSGQDKSGPSDQHGPSVSTAAASSSDQANPKQAVTASTAAPIAVTAAVEGTAEKSPDVANLISPMTWLGFREIYVQYIPGEPHALTHFGAFLYSHDGCHEFRALDGSGLARAVGLRDRDVLLSINNLEAGVSNAHPLAVLECLSDVGTDIGLVIERIERKQKEVWLFAFHLEEKDNRPNVHKPVFAHKFDTDTEKFPFHFKTAPVIPPEASFKVNPVYSYDGSSEVEIILQDSGRFMEIDTDKATYITSKHTLTASGYTRIGSGGEGIPLAISTSTWSSCDNDPKPMCIEGTGNAPLGISIFPSWMTEPGTSIPQNNMFFVTTFVPTGYAIMKAVNTQDLFITHMQDNSDPAVWIANLETKAGEFDIVQNGFRVTSVEDLHRLFSSKAKDS